MAGRIVGVDTGGTFTDFVLLDAQGQVSVRKVASTPHDPAESIIAGLADWRAQGRLDPGFAVVHGTTVATNALLERRGASTALLTTQGFRDVLAIGRQARAELYSLRAAKPDCLLPRERRLEVAERLDWQGRVLVPLDEDQARAAVDALVAMSVESVAVCLLFSYLNPAHERRIGEMAQERGLAVSLSCEIAPEPREYERASTTVANAFVAPIMAGYLDRLAGRLHALDAGQLRVMQSNGGALSGQEAAGQAIKTALSGPAAGVIAAAYVGLAAGHCDLICFDMGGTSTDVALIVDGRFGVETLGEVAGLPLRAPMLDIHTVGAGGGSLARLDAAGGLRVGPQSAGADPGPVAYGKGEALTVTDANLLLGRLPGDVRLAGQMALDTARVRVRFDEFASRMGCAPERAAQGIVQVANAAMARALRRVSVERGYDPARFTLLSYGGAGGLHACDLAEALGMTTILAPRFPGAFSALGLALADVRREYVHALSIGLGTDWQSDETRYAFRSGFDSLRRQAARDLAAEGFAPGEWQAERLIEMRYVGQSFGLRVSFPARSGLAGVVAAFHAAHLARYGHCDPREPVEAVALRLVAVGRIERPPLRMPAAPQGAALIGQSRLLGSEGWMDAPIYAREQLHSDQPELPGPCIVAQEDATTYIKEGWSAGLDADLNLILRRD